MSDQVKRYLDDLVPERPNEMKQMEAYAAEHGFPIIGPAAGYFCYQIARLIGARSVYELGSGYGYSTAWFAKAVLENGGGLVDHVVWDEDLSQKASRHLTNLGYADLDELKPLDIVLVNTRASECIGSEEYLTAGCGMGREATLYLTSRGVRVTGIDAWGWDAPFVHIRKRWLETHDPSIIWEGHKAGREIPYCHMEKLCNLEQLPPDGFTVACFPAKIKAASGGWTRAVAMFD
jgi:hypothetical protein